jgi:hypothetical protein
MRIKLIKRQATKNSGLVTRDPIPLAFSVPELCRTVRFMFIELPLALELLVAARRTANSRRFKTRTNAAQLDIESLLEQAKRVLKKIYDLMANHGPRYGSFSTSNQKLLQLR